MELKGNLNSQSLQEIFTTLAQNKQIGTLIVSDGESSKYIYFARAGVRLLSSGSRKNVRLGDLLVQQNKITPDQLQAVLARQEETGEMVGKILTDWGLVMENEIDEAVAKQIEEEIFDLFTWDNATFKFTEGAPPKELFDPNQRATRLTFDVNHLVQKAARYVVEMQKARDILPPSDTVFQLGEFTELEFYERDDSDPVKRIVKAIDGFRTVQEVVEESGLQQLQAAEILSMLIREKKIEKMEGALPQAEPGRELTDFVGQCERELEKDPQNLALRERLAQAYFDMGEIPKSIHHLSKVVKDAMRSGRLEEALTVTRRIAELQPEDIENHERILRIHFELRDTDGVLSTAAVLADLYYAAGDTERVRNMYKLVLEIVPEDIEIRKKLINLYLDDNDRDGAADEYQAIANILESRGNTSGLYEIYQKISRLAPHRKDLLKKLKSTAEKPVVRIPRSRFHLLKRLFRFAVLLSVLGAIGGAIYWEVQQREQARLPLQEAESMRTNGRFADAIALLESLKEKHKYSLLAYLVIPEKIEEVKKGARREEERKLQEEKERLDGYRLRWEELLARGDEIRQNTGQTLIEELDAWAVDIKTYSESGDNEYTKMALDRLEERKEHVAKAEALLKEAEALEKDGRLLDGRKNRRRILDKFDDTPFAQNLDLPFQILSEPSGAQIWRGDEKLGETPLIQYHPMYGPDKRLFFSVRLAGYYDTDLEIDPFEIQEQTDFTVTMKRRPLWVIKAKESIESPPVVDGPMIYMGSRDGLLYAVDTRLIDPLKEGTWRPAWRFKHSNKKRTGLGGIIYPPAIYKDLVLVPHTASYLYAVKNGTLQWEYGVGVGNAIVGQPLVAVKDKRVIIGTGQGRKGYVICLPAEPRDKPKAHWTYPDPRGPSMPRLASPPVLDGKNRMIFFGVSDAHIHCVDLFTGRAISKFAMGVNAAAHMAYQDGVLFVVTEDSVLHAVDFTRVRGGGMPFSRWTYNIGAPVEAGLLASGGFVIVCARTDKERGMVIAIDARASDRYEVKWTFETRGAIKAAPVVSLNRLYVGSYDRNIYALSFWEGEEAWRFTSQWRIHGIAVQGGTILATTKEGVLFAVKRQ